MTKVCFIISIVSPTFLCGIFLSPILGPLQHDPVVGDCEDEDGDYDDSGVIARDENDIAIGTRKEISGKTLKTEEEDAADIEIELSIGVGDNSAEASCYAVTNEESVNCGGISSETSTSQATSLSPDIRLSHYGHSSGRRTLRPEIKADKINIPVVSLSGDAELQSRTLKVSVHCKSDAPICMYIQDEFAALNRE
ncbi:unnamed protein product [Protopolystoma xenopodis]|uniref:Uncharacterized protein n=1 Tax=Protopolystoma xenopodis TaxID=117903 RepID=A0A448XQM5_9PLAT|nr:unnamed protein product [Protopolystoma xenopodis]